MSLATKHRMKSTALLSKCGLYRYELRRIWDETLPLLAWVMLNPSTADATADDHTIRKVVGFTQRFGAYGGIAVANLFAFRATDPAEMKAAADPIGPDNDHHIVRVAFNARDVMIAWGVHGKHRGRSAVVRGMLGRAPGVSLYHLGTTKHGQPLHPLTLSYSTPREIA